MKQKPRAQPGRGTKIRSRRRSDREKEVEEQGEEEREEEDEGLQLLREEEAPISTTSTTVDTGELGEEERCGLEE